MKIAVLDDNPRDGGALKQFLHFDSHDIHLYQHAVDFLRAVRQKEHFDILFIDYFLDSGLLGTEVVDLIRPYVQDHTRVYIMSGLDDLSMLEDLVKKDRVNVTGVVLKDVGYEAIRRLISELS